MPQGTRDQEVSMRIGLHGVTRTPALSPWISFSIVTHAVLIAGAVVGTERAAQAVLQEITESVYYMAPPDRVPTQAAVVERIRFVRLGAGAAEPAVVRSDAAAPALELAGQPSGDVSSGTDLVSQAAQAAVGESADSVYSVLDVDVSAARMEGSAAPIYPPELRERQVEGSVVARYVVDSTGRAEAESLEIQEATHPEFAQAVRDALPQMRFSPGVVAGRTVRQMVQQRFAFRLTVAVSPAPSERARAVSPP